MAVLSLLSALVLALTATARPVAVPRAPISLAVSGRQRAQALRSSGTLAGANLSEPVINEAVIYTAEVGVGSPATKYNLIVNTGSSTSWVGAVTAYKPTNSSQSTGDIVQVTYELEYINMVTLTNELIIPSAESLI
ncbi:hypothetical protein HDZ31DRAFT_60816 [Schizophyllum fasciatum]